MGYFVCVYPSFFNISMIFSLNSPWISISPSFTLPPTPHFVFSSLPSSFISSSLPTKFFTMVTVFPPRWFFSMLTRSFCCCLGSVSISSFSSVEYWKSGFVEYTMLRRSFQSLFLIFQVSFLPVCVLLVTAALMQRYNIFTNKFYLFAK